MRKQKLEELKNYIKELKTIQVLEQKSLQIIDNKYETSFLTLQKVTCLLGNNQVITREKILKNNQNGSAAIILPITKTNNILLVVQPRIFTDSTVGIELPAGYIEQGEKPITAAKRELIEETGYLPKKMICLSKKGYYQDQGCSSARNYIFLATGCEKHQKQNLDASEFIRYFECTYQEALELAEMGYINDINSLYALEKSKRYIRERKR